MFSELSELKQTCRYQFWFCLHRMRKLESEIQAKDSRIQLLEEDVKNGIKAQAAERARAAETEEASRIAYMQLAASLEVKVQYCVPAMSSSAWIWLSALFLIVFVHDEASPWTTLIGS